MKKPKTGFPLVPLPVADPEDKRQRLSGLSAERGRLLADLARVDAEIAGLRVTQTIYGTVVETVFHDAATLWTVLRAKTPLERGPVTVVGLIIAIEDGANFSARGRWVVHPSHGRQFGFDTIRMRKLTSEAQVIARLKTYPGMKETMAERIVKRFGINALDVLGNEPDTLLTIRGFGKKAIHSITEHHKKWQGVKIDVL
jgi:exodeoxyribonuclease V alpha subunit